MIVPFDVTFDESDQRFTASELINKRVMHLIKLLVRPTIKRKTFVGRLYPAVAV
jgi:hypothetical protein